MARIVVVGAGLTGLAGAMLLANDGHEVIVLERDEAPPPADVASAWGAWSRRGVGQFRQPYAVQPGFTQLARAELPQVLERLAKLGAADVNWLNQLSPELSDRSPWPGDERFLAPFARRPIMEMAFASCAEEQPGLVVRRGDGVAELLSGAGDQPTTIHVKGVRTESGETILADLIVDATGRNTQVGARLAALGAPPPVESEQQYGGTYYSRFYQSRTGALPDYAGGPYFLEGQSVGLFAFPGDNATWCLSVYGLADDAPLRAARRLEVFEAIVRAFPDRENWLDAEPISDVTAFTARSDCTRTFVMDGSPIATGIVALGDAYAYTNPRQGRGTFLGLLQASVLRDTLHDHLGDGPTAMALAWSDAFDAKVMPWLRVTHNIDRVFVADMRTYIAGGVPALDRNRRGQVITNALQNAARVDPEAARWFHEITGFLAPVAEILDRPGLLDRVMELGDSMDPAPRVGPSRAELLRILVS